MLRNQNIYHIDISHELHNSTKENWRKQVGFSDNDKCKAYSFR